MIAAAAAALPVFFLFVLEPNVASRATRWRPAGTMLVADYERP